MSRENTSPDRSERFARHRTPLWDLQKFRGTEEQAGAALEKAGFVHFAVGFHFGQTEYRQSVEGRNSFHFNLSGVIRDLETNLPKTYGDMHNNEYFVRDHPWDHFWHDVMKQ